MKVYRQTADQPLRPLRDSALIYAPLLAFLVSSFLTGFLVDAIAFFVLMGIGAPLLAAVIGARVISALTNFTVNRMLMRDEVHALRILFAGTLHRAGGGHPRSQRGSDGSFDRSGASCWSPRF